MPVVSFCVITYNNEKYIYKALRSIVEANFDFDFEIVIGNDCSTDGTKHEVIRFINGHPDMNITLINRPINLGVVKNYLNILSVAKGDFCLCLDGDDYLDLVGPTKNLASLLIKKEACFIFSHRLFYEDRNTYETIEAHNITLAQSLDGSFLHPGSIFLPRPIVKNLTRYYWLENYDFLDRAIQIEVVRYDSKVFIEDTSVGVYRKHRESTSSSFSSLHILNIVTNFLLDYYRHMKRGLGKSERKVFERRIFTNYLLACHPKFFKNSSIFSKYKNDFEKMKLSTSLSFTAKLFATGTINHFLKKWCLRLLSSFNLQPILSYSKQNKL